MAPRRVKVNKPDYKHLSANDVICPICRSILIKPVTLPCSHGFCASCFENTTQNAKLVCPFCRVRIGSWLRTATKAKKVINETFWQAIQDLFPLQVKNKLNGNGNYVDAKYTLDVTTVDGKKVSDKLLEKSDDMEVNQRGASYNGKKKENPSTSKTASMKTNEPLNTVSISNQIISTNSQPNRKLSQELSNNYATKEYTCRILCQNISETKKSNKTDYKSFVQKKNKRIQRVVESEISDNRSNSIESECLYFKPIDYRHNPPSEGLPPIKVPTRKPNVRASVQIIAPCGHKQINMNSLESAFARLFSHSNERIETRKNEIIEVESNVRTDNNSVKRKLDKLDSKSKKKLKNYKTVQNQPYESKVVSVPLSNLYDSNCEEKSGSFDTKTKSSIKKSATLRQMSKNFMNDVNTKKYLQEKADFELATKLQQSYNQSSKYSTRSSVLKRMAIKNQGKIEEIMTPYKVN